MAEVEIVGAGESGGGESYHGGNGRPKCCSGWVVGMSRGSLERFDQLAGELSRRERSLRSVVNGGFWTR